ncbi:MAG: cytochrome c4 [Pseudomonadales bacterium]|nr:cytochrome c4 [Pseudomonadales bacterium]
MQKTLLAGLLGLGIASVSQAGGDATAGQAKAASCAACHGADGNSFTPMFPKLAGQGEGYIAKQLTDFQTGARSNAMMTPMVIGKTEQDIADIAAYYASQTVTPAVANAKLTTLGEKLYRGGHLEKGIAACTACHGPKAEGLAAAGFPSLQGQWPAYVVAQLTAFRAAGRDDKIGIHRNNDGEARMMRDIAAKMSDQDIEAVSNFISGLK